MEDKFVFSRTFGAGLKEEENINDANCIFTYLHTICIYMIMAMITGMNKRCSSTAIRDSNEDTLMRMCMPIMDVLSLCRFHVYGNQDGTSRAGNPRNLT